MMKMWKLFGLALLLAAGFAACSDDDDNTPEGPGGNPADSVAVGDTTALPPITLDNNAGKFWKVLRQVRPEYGTAMGKTVISDAGFEAFREEADGWCQGMETDLEKMDTIFKMVHNSLRQESVSDQSPEEVWKNKAGICQGFADVFKVFCLTQGIPCIGVNGYIWNDYYSNGAAHAWTFAYAGGEWWMVDPMWGRKFKGADLNKWAADWDAEESETGISWQPDFVGVPLAEDEAFEYSYYKGLSVCSIKDGAGTEVTLPATCAELGGGTVASFKLEKDLPAGVTTLHLGAGIAYLGEEETNLANGCPDLKSYGKNLEWVDVAEGNEMYYSYEGVVYRNGHNGILYIPGAMKIIHVAPLEEIGQEFLYGNSVVEEIWFAEGTKSIDNSAIFENENLKAIYVHEDTECKASFGGVTVTRYRYNDAGEVEIIS